MDTTNEFSNIITPPDFVASREHTVTLIDPEMGEIEDLALLLKTSKDTFNVYVYRSEMNEEDWLQEVIAKSSSVIVNTVNNDMSHYKDLLAAKNQNVWYYGPKNFLMNRNRIEKPIDYFVAYSQ